jgi:hypothetical protein
LHRIPYDSGKECDQQKWNPVFGRSFLTTMIWRQPNKVGFAFGNMTASDVPASDLDERLRKSEQKKQLLQRRIKEILDEG